MLKRINTEQLRLGMHIHELGGSWMDHPFWRSSFLLDNPDDLNTLLSIKIQGVWIDTSKGLDVAEGATEASIRAEVEATLARADTAGKFPVHVETAREAARAIIVCAESRQAVTEMFQEARMGKALDANQALPIVEEISSSVLRNPGALIGLARLKDKDDYTYMHSVAVCALMVALGRVLGLPEPALRQAGMAGLLHDIGKMMIPNAILNKPSKLTAAEFDLIKTHPLEGYEMLRTGKGMSDITMDVCLHHHEKIDGRGYPEQLTSDHISLYARMGAVCDVYDAITSNRPYKNGWEPAESIRKMAEWSKGHFDERVFHAFVKSVGIYPVGSLVKLESNRLGVIIEQSTQSLLTPIVKVFFSIGSNTRIEPTILDLSTPGHQDKIVSHEDPAIWDIPDIHQLWSGLPHTGW